MRWLLAGLGAVLIDLAACGSWDTGKRYVPESPSEDLRVERFLAEALQAELDRDPELASRLGDERNNGRWADRSAAFSEEERMRLSRELVRARTEFDRGELRLEARLKLRARELEIESRLARAAYFLQSAVLPGELAVFDSVERCLCYEHEIDDLQGAEAWIERVRALPEHFAQVGENLRMASASGVLPARPALTAALLANAEEWMARLIAHFEAALARLLNIDSAQKDQLLAHARDAMAATALPARRELERILAELAARALDDGGLWRLPQGESFYAELLRQASSTKLEVSELHGFALAEVERLSDEIRAVMGRLRVAGSLAELLDRMRTERMEETEELALLADRVSKNAQSHLATVRGSLPELFASAALPELVVRARTMGDPPIRGAALLIPRFFENQGAAAWIFEPGEPRWFTPGRLKSRLYRETLPGEFLARWVAHSGPFAACGQSSGQALSSFTAWKAYAEQLARELEPNEAPETELERLINALGRSARLVADSGLHGKGWSTARAEAYLREHSSEPADLCALAIPEILAEPGISAAAVFGAKKLVELRARAKRRLGLQFDLREFHQILLYALPLPVSLLEQRVDAWIATEVR